MLGRFVVTLLFFFGHCVPFLFSPAVRKDVSKADGQETQEVDCSKGDTDGVTIVVFGCIASL